MIVIANKIGDMGLCGSYCNQSASLWGARFEIHQNKNTDSNLKK
jgi:hypothetical protein